MKLRNMRARKDNKCYSAHGDDIAHRPSLLLPPIGCYYRHVTLSAHRLIRRNRLFARRKLLRLIMNMGASLKSKR